MTLGHFSPGQHMPVAAPVIISKFQGGKNIREKGYIQNACKSHCTMNVNTWPPMNTKESR